MSAKEFSITMLYKPRKSSQKFCEITRLLLSHINTLARLGFPLCFIHDYQSFFKATKKHRNAIVLDHLAYTGCPKKTQKLLKLPIVNI